MKKLLLTVIAATALFNASAQENRKGELRLKSGKTIKGIFVEKSDNGDIVMEASDGNEYEYEADEISKFSFVKNDKFRRKKGYIGLSVGPSIPLSVFQKEYGGYEELGLNLSLINFGILFGDYFGVAATLLSSTGQFEGCGSTDDLWTYGGISVGPLFSFPISKKVEIDLRPMFGYSVRSLTEVESGNYSYSVNAMLRFHLGGRVSMTGDATYFYPFSALRSSRTVSSMSCNLGFAIRFK